MLKMNSDSLMTWCRVAVIKEEYNSQPGKNQH